MRRKACAVVVAVLGALGIAGLAVAGFNGNWSTHLAGGNEVPENGSHGQGQAILKLSKDGTEIHYKLIASNIENIVMAHIHIGAPGSNGPISVWLYPSTTPGVLAPAGGGRTDGNLIEGSFTADAVGGPLAGEADKLGALIARLDGGQAYVNMHTNDGIAPFNTGPGDIISGEIRGNVD